MSDTVKNSVRMLVRRYVMELMQRNSGTAVKLPSNDALAQKLNIARSTAQLEIKLLINEGFLTTKAGIGTFTNPLRGPVALDGKPLIALFDGDGKTVYYEYSAWEFKAHIGAELAKLPATIEDCKIYSERKKDILAELLNMECNAFVWIKPSKEIKPVLAELGRHRQVFVVREDIPNTNLLLWDDAQFGYDLGKELLRHGRRKPLYLNTLQNSPLPGGLAKAFAETGLSFPKEHCFNSADAREELLEKLESGYRPDSIIFRHEDGDFLVKKLLELGIDLEEECRLVSIMFKPRCLKAPILLYPLDFRRFASIFADMLARHLDDSSLPPERICDSLKTEMKLI